MYELVGAVRHSSLLLFNLEGLTSGDLVEIYLDGLVAQLVRAHA